MRPSSILIAILILFLPLGCSEDPAVPAADRFLYYIAGDESLRRYSISSQSEVTLSNDKLWWITSVADNGIVLYATESAGVMRLWGVCDDDVIIPVPMPVTESPAEEYILSATPASLSREGHHAAFIVYKKPGNSIDSTEWTAHLCVFDCGVWRMSMADISSFVSGAVTIPGFSADIVSVHSVFLSASGDATVMLLHISDAQPDGSFREASVLLVHDNAGFRVLDTIRGPEDARLNRFVLDTRTFTAYVDAGNSFAVDCRTGISTPFDYTIDAARPHHVLSATTSEYVYAKQQRIALVRLDNGSESIVVEDVSAVLADHADLRSGRLADAAVSPDGEWLAFLHETTDNAFALYVLRRDGGELRRVAKGMIGVPFVLSNPLR